MIVSPGKIRNYAYRSFSVASAYLPGGGVSWRGPSLPAWDDDRRNDDRIARKLGIDPAEVRRRNVTTADMPWVSAVGVRYDTGSHS